MPEPTEIEKKSLEAHVELCAQRYKHLEDKLQSVEEKCDQLVASIAVVKQAMEAMALKNNDRLISWGIGIIGFLLASVTWMVQHYVLK